MASVAPTSTTADKQTTEDAAAVMAAVGGARRASSAALEGDFTPLGMMMKKYDVNGDGVFSVTEVRAIVDDVTKLNSTNKLLSKGVWALLGLVVLLIGALCGVSIVGAVVGGESIKESRVKAEGKMTAQDGSVVSVAQASIDYGLWDLPALTTAQLGEFSFLDFYIDMTSNPAVGDWSLAFFKPTGAFKKTADSLVLSTAEGYTIDIDRVAMAATITMGAATYTISDTAPSVNGRRKLLDQMAEQVAPSPKPPRARRALRRGAALMTMGSFTMMSTNAGGNQ